MKHAEMVKLLTFISKSYIGRLRYPSDNHIEDEALEETWMTFLKEYPFEPVMLFLKDYIPKNAEWPPTIGQIVNALEGVLRPEKERKTAEEAWDEVLGRVVCGDYSTEGLSGTTRIAITNAGGMRYIDDYSKTDPFVQKTFIAAYNSVTERREQEPDREMIEGIRSGIDQLTDKFRKPALNE